jgi:hypothetical protein
MSYWRRPTTGSSVATHNININTLTQQRVRQMSVYLSASLPVHVCFRAVFVHGRSKSPLQRAHNFNIDQRLFQTYLLLALVYELSTHGEALLYQLCHEIKHSTVYQKSWTLGHGEYPTVCPQTHPLPQKLYYSVRSVKQKPIL